MLKRLALVSLLLCTPLQAAPAPPKPYHIQLEVNIAAPFPFLSKFGTVTLHVYPAGVRADTLWLYGFTRNGASTVTVENPYGRMYTYVTMSEITNMLHKTPTEELSAVPHSIVPPISGKVRGIPARRYRLLYGPEAWIDIWTTEVVPENPQLRTLVDAFVRGISPSTADSLKLVPGTPLYVELNFRRYKKLPLIRLKSFSRSSAGQEDALKVGALYFKAPLLDSLLK
jgi:hypothetical protein